MNFGEMLKELPQKPGIYKMIDAQGTIIYVGKAKNLKNRVAQYFRTQKDRAPKVVEMIHNIRTFNYQVTDTELDAFIEECRLIKELKPRYNRQMKNTKYLYLKLPAEPFPKVTIAKEKTADGAVYFGPFTSRHRVESTVQFLQDCYPIRRCTSPKFIPRPNGCLFGQLGSCLGACTGRISPEEYGYHIAKIQQLLNGNDPEALAELSQKVQSAIEELKFEQAAQYHEYYSGLRHVIGKQRLVQASNRNRNILAVEFMDNDTAKLFYIRGNKLLNREVVKFSGEDTSNLKQHLQENILSNFPTAESSRVGLSQQDIDEAQIIYSYLKKNKHRVMSFWIPSNRLGRDRSRLEGMVSEIVNRIVKSKV